MTAHSSGITGVMLAAARIAAELYERVDQVPVSRPCTPHQLREALGGPLPIEPRDPEAVIERLMRSMEDGLVWTGGPRFFGWALGGVLPSAVAADWLVSALDQTSSIYASSPASSIIEEVVGGWLKELLRLPADASFSIVTGCQMAHFACLAAARSKLLAERDVDVEQEGLAGAPALRILTGQHRHESLLRAAQFLGLGRGCVCEVPSRSDGGLDGALLRRALEASDRPSVVALMAGDLHTGAFDAFDELCDIAHEHGAWVHVDGAIGLWLRTSPGFQHLLDGVERADSWATDGHKLLQLPFDHGFAFVRDRDSHRRALGVSASYLLTSETGVRDQIDWTPEWSRRARGLVAYVALETLGRSGIASIVENCCLLADALIREIGRIPAAEVLAPARACVGLVRFRSPDGNHDRLTEAVAERVRRSGVAWFGCSRWKGSWVMRISVCSHRTTRADIARAAEAVRAALGDELSGVRHPSPGQSP